MLAAHSVASSERGTDAPDAQGTKALEILSIWADQAAFLRCGRGQIGKHRLDTARHIVGALDWTSGSHDDRCP